MLIETCTSFNDKYVQVDYPPVPEWENELNSHWHEYFEKRHPIPLLAWHIAIHFVDKRKDIPGDCDKRSRLGAIGVSEHAKNSCDIFIWTKASHANKNAILHASEKYIAKYFTDNLLHYNSDGHACHCKRGEERRIKCVTG